MYPSARYQESSDVTDISSVRGAPAGNSPVGSGEGFTRLRELLRG
jgi:hypothetical protein